MASLACYLQPNLLQKMPLYYNLENFKEYPIHYYIAHSQSESKTIEKIEYIMEKFSSINDIFESDMQLCLTPLMASLITNQTKVAEKLIECLKTRGILVENLKINDALGKTAREYARDKPEILKLLPTLSTRQELQNWTVSRLDAAHEDEDLQVHMAHLNVTVVSPRNIDETKK